ncbi:MAG: insulinase family protein [Candidatus Competibacteraceae bacterium]
MTSHSAFEGLRRHPIAALRLEFQEYRHRVTGARHIHLAADDNHNAFLVAFLTVPQDSTGVAHMLEHTVLCGSRHYPVRDPFFMMTRRSLHTFMNAFTSNDWTAYPFASQNVKDFNNLLAVYLDCVFFPLLDELDFAQEGYRLEFTDPQDPASELIFKGVVYNEMKGALSSPVQNLAQTLQSHLFPTTTYHYNSGGDPRHIPELASAGLKAFHARHYHPSNAVFMTYGDIPAAEHQRRFEEQALAQFQPLDLQLQIHDEVRYPAPLAVEARYALDGEHELQDKTHIVLAWLLNKITDPHALLQARILSDVLLDNGSSPLRRVLETSELGTAPSPLCGFDSSTREATFVCGLEGSNPEQAQATETLIFEVIREVAEKGVPQESLESALHQLELSQREITGDGLPYGLHLLLEVLPAVLHDGDPVATLDIEPLLQTLQQEIQDPAFIKNLARDLLLENAHRVRLVMAPDNTLAARLAEEEKQRLQALQAKLTPAQRERLLEQAQALQARQTRLDDPELLPRVGLEDIPAELKIASGHTQVVAGLPTTWYAQGTNGMVYQQIVVNLPALDDAMLELLPLFCLCLTEVGSGGRDYLATQARQSAVTGGLSARSLVRGGVDDVQQSRGVLVLAGKALVRNQAALTELLVETFAGARFDELPRLRELIAQVHAQREEGVVEHGHLLAMTAASAGLSPVAALSHRWEGLRGLQSLKALDATLDDKDALIALATRFEQLRELIMTAPRQLLVVSEAERQEAIATTLTQYWRDYPDPASTGSDFSLPATDACIRQGWSTSTQVNFCAKAYPTVPQNHPDAPALQVLGDFLRNGYLHRAVREQGGAYGAGAGYHPDSGAFRFFSYRDPRLNETLEDFDRSLLWLQQNDHPTRTLEEAILGVIAAIDRPGSPAGEAISAFFGQLFGRTPEQRRAFRQRIVKVTLDDLKRVAAIYLVPERASLAVVSDPETLSRQDGLEVIAL